MPPTPGKRDINTDYVKLVSGEKAARAGGRVAGQNQPRAGGDGGVHFSRLLSSNPPAD